MKLFFGLLLIIGGIALGLYVGFWVMFIGGIVGLVNIVKNGAYEAMPIALNIAKIIFAIGVGALCGYALVVPGFAILNS